MSALYPTPTRLALHAATRDGKVSEEWYADQPGTAWLNEYPGRRTRVTSKVAEMEAGRLVRDAPGRRRHAHPSDPVEVGG